MTPGGRDDYVGCEFGTFRITEHAGSGDEDERFWCEHLINGNRYMLRLDRDDPGLAGGAPVLPPANAAMERDAARWFWELGHSEAGTPGIYGVLDGRYVVALASPIWVRDAWPIDRFLDATSLESGWLHRISLYQDAMLSMLKEAVLDDLVGGGHFDERWRLLTGGQYLTSTIGGRRHLLGAGVDTKRLMKRLSRRERPDEPELADNLLIRLAASVLGSVVPGEVARATLRCPQFFRNLSHHELEQVEALLAAWSEPVAYESETLAQNIEMLEMIRAQVYRRPFDLNADAAEFTMLPAGQQPALDSYTTLLWQG